MCVFMCACVCVCEGVKIYIHKLVYFYWCARERKKVCSCVHVYVCVRVCMCERVCKYTFININIRVLRV